MLCSIAGNFYILLYYLPIYFQAIRNTTATESGIRSLPLILGISKQFPLYGFTARHCTLMADVFLALAQIVVGVAIGETGIFNPYLIIGGIISTVASGMLLTLKTNSGSSVWIGYQALAGIGLGTCFTVPIIVTQMISKPDEVATATGVLLCKSQPLKAGPISF